MALPELSDTDRVTVGLVLRTRAGRALGRTLPNDHRAEAVRDHARNLLRIADLVDPAGVRHSELIWTEAGPHGDDD